MPWASFFECWVLSHLLHSPLSPSSRGSLVPPHFLPLKWYHLHILRLLFLLAVLIPACVSPTPAFHMMYSAYKLNKQVTVYSLDVLLFNFEPVCCPVCCFLSCIHISQEAGKVIWYSCLMKNFPQFVMIHTVKCFSIVNEAEVDFFNPLAFSMIQQMLAIWSLLSLPFLNLACTS